MNKMREMNLHNVDFSRHFDRFLVCQSHSMCFGAKIVRVVVGEWKITNIETPYL